MLSGNMVKISALISALIIFSGCTAPRTKLPTFIKLEPLKIEWYWLPNGTPIKEFHDKKVVITSQQTFQEIQEALINGRLGTNACIDIIDSYNNSIK